MILRYNDYYAALLHAMYNIMCVRRLYMSVYMLAPQITHVICIHSNIPAITRLCIANTSIDTHTCLCVIQSVSIVSHVVMGHVVARPLLKQIAVTPSSTARMGVTKQTVTV